MIPKSSRYGSRANASTLRYVEAEVKREGKRGEIEILPNSEDVCLSLLYYRISAERELGKSERSTIISKSNFLAAVVRKGGEREPLRPCFSPTRWMG